MTAVSKWCVQTNLQALEIHWEARRALPCCFNHPWQLEGALTPCFADHGWASPNQLKVKLIFVPLWHKCEWSLEMPLVSPSRVRAEGNSVGIAVLWCSYTHSGALLLHLIYCEGPTPSSAWCCHLQAERGVSFYRHLVTTEPANQSGRPAVAALSLGSRPIRFGDVFAVYSGKVV